MNVKKKIKTVIMCMSISMFIGKSNAQFAVIDPANLAQGIVNSIEQITEMTTTASNVINNCAPV